MDQASGFAERLRWWRSRRGFSQLMLAGEAAVSQRHLSFLELGRARPSRDMVLRLAAALDLRFRERNQLLLAAGFAPLWREGQLGGEELAVVNRALDHMLCAQEPYPALVVDRRWNLLRANTGARRLFAFLATGAPEADVEVGEINLVEAVLAPAPLRPLIVNWREVALCFVAYLRADALADGAEETQALLQRVLLYPDVPGPGELAELTPTQAPVLTIVFERSGRRLPLFTTIATLGTPMDVTAQEIRIENFFPADEAGEALFHEWAAADGPAYSTASSRK